MKAQQMIVQMREQMLIQIQNNDIVYNEMILRLEQVELETHLYWTINV